MRVRFYRREDPGVSADAMDGSLAVWTSPHMLRVPFIVGVILRLRVSSRNSGCPPEIKGVIRSGATEGSAVEGSAFFSPPWISPSLRRSDLGIHPDSVARRR